MHNVPLPEYDVADIELLLGKEFAVAKITDKNSLSKFEDKLRDQIIRNTLMAKILLKECDETVSSYRERGDCFVESS